MCRRKSKKAEAEWDSPSPSMQRTEPPLFVQFRLNTNMSSSELQSVQQTTEPSSVMDRRQPEHHLWCKYVFKNSFICSNAKETSKQKKNDFSSCDYSLFAASRSAQISAACSLAIVSSSSSSPPSRGGHSTPLSSPPVVMTTEGVCLSAGHHSEQSYSTTGNTSRLIYSERSCHWWFLVWTSAVWPLKNTSCLLLVR